MRQAQQSKHKCRSSLIILLDCNPEITVKRRPLLFNSSLCCELRADPNGSKTTEKAGDLNVTSENQTDLLDSREEFGKNREGRAC